MKQQITPNAVRDQLVSYFREGQRGERGPQLIGVEVEHFVIDEDGMPLPYEAGAREIGAVDVIEHLTHVFPERVRDGSGNLLGAQGANGSVSLEPASQLELSVAPHPGIARIEQTYAAFRTVVDPYLNSHGYHLDTSGYHPTQRAGSLETTPEERYAYMSDYFSQLETNGELMMRATAATHVSIDYQDESDAIRKLRVASAMAPVLAAIADNTHVFEGVTNHRPVRRFLLWREVDPRRCGTIPGVFSAQFGFGAYADWVLAASPIYTKESGPEGTTTRAAFGEPAYEAYGNRTLSQHDVRHLLSVVWPDARLKQVVEIRVADSMPADCIMGYAALVKGVFYSEEALAALEADLGTRNGKWTLTSADVASGITQIAQWGHAALLYERELRWWIERLFTLAHRTLDSREQAYLEPLRTFAFDKPWWDVR